MIAPPAIAMIKNDDPTLVNLPKPAIAKGQIAGHTSAFAKPNNEMHKTDVNPSVKIAPRPKASPTIAEILKAFSCDKYFGMQKIPITYPTNMAIKV